jgi:DNA-binding CsgD family transcriptional regulator
MSAVFDVARLRVLRATVLICLLISVGNLVGAFAGFTASGDVIGPAPALGAAWCILWALAARFPSLTARQFAACRRTALVLAAANALTVGVTGGIESPLLAVCMYVGWIASVVVRLRAALAVSVAIAVSVLAGYLLAGASISDIFTGPHRYDAVTNAALPVITGSIGVLLAFVTNTTFGRLGPTLAGLRTGELATSPALTALFAGRPVLELPVTSTAHQEPAARVGLTAAEAEVVRLLASGFTPKQIAHLRGVALSTVRSQLKRAKQKTGAGTLAELARYADL